MRALVTALLLVCSAFSQDPDPKAAARAEIAKAVRGLDVVLEQIAAAQESVRAAIALAKQAQAQAKDVDMERAARLTEELQATLNDLNTAIAQRVDGLRGLRDKTEAEAPAPPPDPLAAIKERVRATSKMESLKDAREGLNAVEKELSSDAMKGSEAAAKLLSLVRYRFGDTLLRQARLEQDSIKREELMTRAVGKFNVAREGPDSANTEEGSSLHAVALLRVVQIEVVLRNGYLERSGKWKKNESAQSAGDKQTAREHDQSAKDGLEKIERLFGAETLPDGRKVLDAARDAYRRIK